MECVASIHVEVISLTSVITLVSKITVEEKHAIPESQVVSKMVNAVRALMHSNTIFGRFVKVY